MPSTSSKRNRDGTVKVSNEPWRNFEDFRREVHRRDENIDVKDITVKGGAPRILVTLTREEDGMRFDREVYAEHFEDTPNLLQEMMRHILHDWDQLRGDLRAAAGL